MKRWMENKVARQSAYRKMVNGMSARFAPTSKVASVCVPYTVTPKGNAPEYDGSMVRRVASEMVAAEPVAPWNVRMKKARRKARRVERKQLGALGLAMQSPKLLKNESRLIPKVT